MNKIYVILFSNIAETALEEKHGYFTNEEEAEKYCEKLNESKYFRDYEVVELEPHKDENLKKVGGK